VETRLFFIKYKIMHRLLTRYFISYFAFILSISSQAQDTVSLFKWNSTSKKLSEGKYTLIFSTPGVNGWQLYAPNQAPGGVNTVELSFPDSSITIEGNFSEAGESKNFNSTIFESNVRVYESNTEWKAIINIRGTVPAQLQGKLSYFYGNDTAFNSDLPLLFNIALEGGVVASTKIKVSSIDINNPVSPCGDEGTKNKSILTIFLLGLFGGIIALLTPCVFL